MFQKPHKAAWILLLGLMFFAQPTGANESSNDLEQGLEVALRSDRSDLGFSDSLVTLRMVLRNREGHEAVRELEIRTLERQDESVGDKTLIVFSSPADLEGTALLSHARLIEPDDQWLYLPSLKRVKRIASVNKSGPFLGSEFAFEDFTAQEAGKFSYRYLRSESCGELLCDVVERQPLYEHSGYQRQVVWIDQEIFQFRKIDLYDRAGALFKTLTFDDYRPYGGHLWRAHFLHMVNHSNGKSTDLQFGPFRFANGLRQRDFDKGALQRLW